jgi:hypothetical protein
MRVCNSLLSCIISRQDYTRGCCLLYCSRYRSSTTSHNQGVDIQIKRCTGEHSWKWALIFGYCRGMRSVARRTCRLMDPPTRRNKTSRGLHRSNKLPRILEDGRDRAERTAKTEFRVYDPTALQSNRVCLFHCARLFDSNTVLTQSVYAISRRLAT